MSSDIVKKRTLRLKDKLLSSEYALCLERIKYMTEIYKENNQDPEILKRAKAIAHVLKNMTIFMFLSITAYGFATLVDSNSSRFPFRYKEISI